MAICGQGMQRKRRIEQLSLGNGKVEEFKLVKHDGALYFSNMCVPGIRVLMITSQESSVVSKLPGQYVILNIIRIYY